MELKELKILASQKLEYLIPHMLPGGYVEGEEYIVKNPNRTDEKAGSFKINLRKGFFADFADTSVRGGDVFDLAQFVYSVSPHEAFKKVEELLGVNMTIKASPKKDVNPYHPIDKIPPRAIESNELKCSHLGELLETYCFRDENNNILYYDVKFIKPDGEKNVLPASWCKHKETGFEKYAFKAPLNRIPFNYAGILSHQNVLVVEGGKCAERALNLIGNKVAVTYALGGSSAISKTDWSCLKDKSLIIWPDNDEPGYKSASQLAKIAEEFTDKILIMTDLFDKPKGWDVADYIEEEKATAKKLTDFIKQNSKRHVKTEEIEEDLREYEEFQEPEHSATDYFEDLTYSKTETKPFRCLGHNKDQFYYLPRHKGQIVALTAPAHNSSNLIMLAPKFYWEEKYPSKKGVSWSCAQEALINECMDKGIFHPDKIRGRGAWRDGADDIIHTGDKIVVNNKNGNLIVDPVDYEGEFIYERSVSLKSRTEEMSTKEEGLQFIDLCKSFPWKSEHHGVLVAGWAFLAPICGALNWRSHIWITGEAGSGKSWFKDNVLKQFVSGFGASAQGNTTAAGIRQHLLRDALPVLFDEAESNDRKGAERIAEVIELMRQASSPGESAIIKGGAGGESQSFIINASFALVSIVTAINNQADKGRISLLELMEWNSHTESVKGTTREEHFKYTENAVSELLGDGRSHRFRNRAFNNILRIKKNIETFNRVCAKYFGTQRTGDQIGTLLAGAYCAASDGIANDQAVLAFIEKHNWEEQISAKSEKDHDSALSHLLEYVITVRGEVTRDRTIKRLITDVMLHNDDNQVAKEALEMVGILVPISGNNVFQIRKGHSGLNKIFRDTPWGSGYYPVLSRIDGANIVPRKIKTVGGGMKSERLIEINGEFLLDDR